MNKSLGILGLFLAICLFTTWENGQFVGGFNLENLFRRTALFGFIGIGAAFVIITGGIDLSIGSLIALTGCLLPMLLTVDYQPTGQPLQVTQVVVEEKTIQLSGPAPPLSKDDRLMFSSDAGTQRHLTVDSARASDQGVTVEVLESPQALSAGDEVTPALERHMPIPLAVTIVLLLSAAIGLKHGLLITKLRLPPFVVTLCSLLIYRGLARTIAEDQIKGFGVGFEGFKYLAGGKPFSIPVPFLKWISEGDWSRFAWDRTLGEYKFDETGERIALPFLEWVGVPMPAIMLAGAAVLAIVFLNYSIYGRYLLALGNNERAARLSGVNTDRLVIAAYVLCAMLSGFTGMMFALDLNSIQPASHGNFYELYGIAAAVLGGCSLRGGEGSIIGVILGTAVMQTLQNSINMTPWIPKQIEYTVIGGVLLTGVIMDELAKRMVAKRKTSPRRRGLNRKS